MTHSKPIAINEHGQITIPKFFRALLKSRTILLKTEKKNDAVIEIIPVQDVGGSLAKHRKGKVLEFREEREIAWEEAVTHRFKRCKNT